jgi:hypothetical protein
LVKAKGFGLGTEIEKPLTQINKRKINQ